MTVSTKSAPARKRKTRQRDAVLGVLRGEPDFVSAADVFARLQTRGASVGLATVYRNLAALAAEGTLDQLRSPDGTMLFRECDNTLHHHHLVCRNCGKTQEFQLDGLEETLNKLAHQRGYTEIEHVVELTGVCADCAVSTPDTPESSSRKEKH